MKTIFYKKNMKNQGVTLYIYDIFKYGKNKIFNKIFSKNEYSNNEY